MGAWHVAHYPKLGPIDEQAHIDYLLKVRDGHVPRLNEYMGQEALAEEACRGFDSAYVPPPCLSEGERYDPTTFQFGGVSAASGHPPVYYGITALAAAPISVLPGISSFVTAARIATSLWLAAALCIIWWVLRRHGSSAWVAGAVIAIVGTAPQLIHASATVNPDSTALFAGALMLAAALHRWPTLLIAAAWLVVLLKATNVLAVLAAALLVVLLGWRDNRLRSFIIAGGMVFAAAAASVLWAFITHVRAIVPPDSAVPIPGRPPEIIRLLFNFLPPTGEPPLPPFFATSQPVLAFMGMTHVLLLSVAVGAALLLTAGRIERVVGWVSIVGMLLGPTVLMIAISVAANNRYTPPTRYGISIIPFLLFCFLAARTRAAHAVLVLYAVGVTGTTVYAISRSPFV